MLSSRMAGRWFLFLVVMAVGFGSMSPAALADTARGAVIEDRESGLSWLADAQYLMNSGLSAGVLITREQAQAAVRALNDGLVENFGYSDWRLPTRHELFRLLEAGALEGLEPATVETALGAVLGGDLGMARSDLMLALPVRGSGILPGFSDVVIFATNSVRLKNQSQVMSGDVVVNDASPGPTLVSNYEFGMDPRAETAPGTTVKADSVRLKRNATVNGDVHYNDIDLKGTIGGAQISPLDLPVFALVPRFFSEAPAPGSPDVTVDEEGFVVLPAGDYGEVSVGEEGTLVLTGGIYNVASIRLEEKSSLLFRAPGEVRVEGRVAGDSQATVGSEAGSGVLAQEIVFYVAGINGADGGLDSTPRAAEIGNSSTVDANFYVPNGTLRLGQGTVATGAFLGRDVLVENRAKISLDSFFFNLPPVAVDDSATVDEGGTVSVLDSGATSVLDNDSDPNGDPLTVTTTPVTGPVNGTLTLASDGTFTYTHDGGETISDSFEYEVCDDNVPAECDTATVSITVNPVNDPPVAGDDSATVGQGESTSVLDSGETSVLANDSDVDSTTLTVTTTPVSGPEHGNLTLAADGTFTYAHGSNEELTDSFVYEVCDDGTPAACSTGTVTITVLPPVIVRVTRFGLGDGEVTSAPAGIDCGLACVASFPATGGDIVLTAVAFGDSVFAGFSGDADCADGVLSPDGDKNCLARFDASAVPAVVSITKAGDGSGTVTSSPAGIDCGATCSAGFPIPTRVLLTATPDPGSAFVGWTGPADCADGNLDVTGDIACGAVFELQPARITVVKFGLGDGTVTSDPAGIDCGSTCSATFPGTSSVTLSADPDGNSVFSGFSGDPDCADGVVTPDVDKTCFARFDTSAVPGTLSVTLAGSGSGRVTTDPAGVDCPGVCSAGFSIPTRVVLNAVADEGSEFVGWSGDADCADGNVEIGGDVDCTATFETVVTPSGFTLTVVYLGTSSGAVTSSPIGIFCEVSGCSAEFPSGTTVTLFARPLGTLGGWGGDCSGSNFSTSVVMDADKTCTVTFDP